MLGEHILKTYSSAQPTISLSSGEAEFYGVVRAAGAALVGLARRMEGACDRRLGLVELL